MEVDDKRLSNNANSPSPACISGGIQAKRNHFELSPHLGSHPSRTGSHPLTSSTGRRHDLPDRRIGTAAPTRSMKTTPRRIPRTWAAHHPKRGDTGTPPKHRRGPMRRVQGAAAAAPWFKGRRTRAATPGKESAERTGRGGSQQHRRRRQRKKRLEREEVSGGLRDGGGRRGINARQLP